MPRSPRTSNTSVISANRKNRNFAIDAVPALVLLKPNTPEMNEMIAKMMAHLSICLLLVLIENSVWFIARLRASNKTEKFWICVVIKNDGVMQHYVSLVSITITTLPGLWFVPGTQNSMLHEIHRYWCISCLPTALALQRVVKLFDLFPGFIMSNAVALLDFSCQLLPLTLDSVFVHFWLLFNQV